MFSRFIQVSILFRRSCSCSFNKITKMDSIPVIDLDFFTNCESITDNVLNDAKTKQIAEQIRIALHEVGFMYLINHRVSPVVVRFIT